LKAEVEMTADIVLVVAIVAAGLLAGLFWTFQVSVIPGLADVEDVAYVRTFQAINERIQNAWFLVVFMGTTPLVIAALVLQWSSGDVAALVAAGLVLELAVLAITAGGNIPLNNALAGRDAVTPETAAAARADFESRWNRLNLVRALVSVAGFACLAAAAIGA
jgi:uncharacterized membrane protein